jgi:hypothetical protein
MIRTVITPDKNLLSINIPDKYIGKKMEVIAFLMDEPAEDVIYTAKRSKSFSAIKLNTKGFKFNRDEANER